jgi:hypothetical protein
VELSTRGNVRRGKVRGGNVRQGKCPPGEMSSGEMSSGEMSSGESPKIRNDIPEVAMKVSAYLDWISAAKLKLS